jgi:phosphatidylserine/phosphatidylglycerophosphate/cardiolipin synthase-like enzyme
MPAEFRGPRASAPLCPGGKSRTDRRGIDTAKQEIDVAADVLTDWPVIRLLKRAAERGVRVRVYLDGVQLAEREPAKVLRELATAPSVEIRTKRAPHADALKKAIK